LLGAPSRAATTADWKVTVAVRLTDGSGAPMSVRIAAEHQGQGNLVHRRPPGGQESARPPLPLRSPSLAAP
jgi:hypothetical protein